MTSTSRKFSVRSWCLMPPDVIESKAFEELRGKWPLVCLLRFYQKVHRKNGKGKKGLKGLQLTNNGELVFTYGEAVEMGMCRKTFYSALRELVEDKGFIDVREVGNFYEGQSQKYAISERWRKYDTPEFEIALIPKDSRYRRNGSEKQNP